MPDEQWNSVNGSDTGWNQGTDNVWNIRVNPPLTIPNHVVVICAQAMGTSTSLAGIWTGLANKDYCTLLGLVRASSSTTKLSACVYWVCY